MTAYYSDGKNEGLVKVGMLNNNIQKDFEVNPIDVQELEQYRI